MPSSGGLLTCRFNILSASIRRWSASICWSAVIRPGRMPRTAFPPCAIISPGNTISRCLSWRPCCSRSSIWKTTSSPICRSARSGCAFSFPRAAARPRRWPGRSMPCCTAARTTAACRRPKSSARSSACWPACSGWRRRTLPGSTASTLSSASCCKARRPKTSNGSAQRCSIPLMTIWRSWTSSCARRRPCSSSMCRTRPRRFAAAQ